MPIIDSLLQTAAIRQGAVPPLPVGKQRSMSEISDSLYGVPAREVRQPVITNAVRQTEESEAQDFYSEFSWLNAGVSQQTPTQVNSQQPTQQPSQAVQLPQQVYKPEVKLFDDVITPEALLETYNKYVDNGALNFATYQFSPEDVAKIQQGDMTPFNVAVNKAAAVAVAEAVKGTLNVLQSRLPDILGNSFSEYKKVSAETEAARERKGSNPLEKFVADMAAKQYLAVNPYATPAEINGAVSKLLKAITTQQSSVNNVNSNSAPDWSEFLGE